MGGGTGRRKFLVDFLGLLSFGVFSITNFKKAEGFKVANLISDVLSVRSADATTLNKEQFICANCGNIFSEDIPESTNALGGKDSELRVYALGRQPYRFFIHTCPRCGCPDTKLLCRVGNNGDEIAISDQKKKEIEKFLISYRNDNKVKPEFFTPAQKYEVLANIDFILGNPPSKIAEAFLYAAWMADDEEKLEKSKFYREKSIEFFTKALNSNELNEHQRQTVTYLIGELYRRIKNYEKAIYWFAKVKSDSKTLMNLCERQRKLCLEKKSQRAMIDCIQGNPLLK